MCNILVIWMAMQRLLRVGASKDRRLKEGEGAGKGQSVDDWARREIRPD